MTPAELSLIDTLTAIHCREGYPFEKDDPELHRAHIKWEWQSGQWVMVTGKKNKLLGWSSYYLVDNKTLALFNEIGLEQCIKDDQPINLVSGEHIYIASAIIMPYAPNNVFRKLYNALKKANPKAKSITAHRRARNGKARRLHRTIN